MNDTVSSRPGATAAGLAAIGLWGTLALLTTLAGPLPPFQMVAVTFILGAGLGFTVLAASGRPLSGALARGWQLWLLGVGGLFGFHALFFAALQLAPPAEANLVNYLWPLLIVLLSAPLTDIRLRWWHCAGAALGLAGIALLLLARSDAGWARGHWLGYLCALGSALAWAVYSVLSRRYGSVPTDTVAGFCAATALLAIPCHLAFEATRWPADITGWLAIALIGLGPTGAAFYLWDYAVKHGDIRILGALAYLAPVLSTLLLVLAGTTAWSSTLALATLLVVGGAMLAARDSLRRRPTQR